MGVTTHRKEVQLQKRKALPVWHHYCFLQIFTLSLCHICWGKTVWESSLSHQRAAISPAEVVVKHFIVQTNPLVVESKTCHTGESQTQQRMLFLLRYCPFLDSSVTETCWKTEITIQFWRQESQQRICMCIKITLYFNLTVSEGLALNQILHYSLLIPNIVSDLRFINCCSSWEVMLTRWAPCMRHSLSAASQLFLWG